MKINDTQLLINKCPYIRQGNYTCQEAELSAQEKKILRAGQKVGAEISENLPKRAGKGAKRVFF
jgi:hypothetical protein